MKKFLALVTLTIITAITYFAITPALAERQPQCGFTQTARLMPHSNTAELFFADGTSANTNTQGLIEKLQNAPVHGFLVRYSGDKSAIRTFLQIFSAREVYNQQLGAITVTYAFARSFDVDTVRINNRRQNLQIAYRAGIITIGVPLILGSF